MTSYWTTEKIKEWVFSQNWYQRIHVIDDIITPGKIDNSKRLSLMNLGDLNDKSVLDVGCNSGLLCFEAKKHDASKVLGVDINTNRLEQAKKLAEIMNLDVKFKKMDISNILELGTFDITFCISLLTEVPDIIQPLLNLKKITNETLFLELAISPMPNFSRTLIKFVETKISRIYGRCYLRKLKNNNWTLIPNMTFLKALLGDKFNIKVLGGSSRYTLIRCDIKH